MADKSVNKKLTVAETATRLGVSQRNVRRMAKRGDLPPVYIGLDQTRLLRFEPSDVEKFVATRRTRAP